MLTGAEKIQDLDIPYETTIEEIIQSEMTKITVLSSEMLRNIYVSRSLDAQSAQVVSGDLQQWHDNLPPPMRLAGILDLPYPPIILSAIYYIHLLYLGALILLYRRVMFDQAATTDVLGVLAQDATHVQVLHHARMGITAAKLTARVLGVLKDIDGVMPRCWLVMSVLDLARWQMY